MLDRTRSQPRKFCRIRPARLDELLGARGPAVPDVAHHEDGGPGSASTSARRPDPTDRQRRHPTPGGPTTGDPHRPPVP